MKELLKYYARSGFSRLFDSELFSGAVDTWVVTRDDHEDVANRVWKFGESDTFTFTEPVSLDPIPREIAEKTGEISISQPFVSEFTDVDLVGPDAMTISDLGLILENSVGSRSQFSMSAIRTVKNGYVPVRRGTDETLETAVSFVGPWANGYYHWFFDYLLRVDGLKRYEDEFDVEPKVIIPNDPPPWMEDLLRYAGIPEVRCVEWSGGRVRVQSLIVPSLRRDPNLAGGNLGYVFSPRAYRQLADTIKQRVSPEDTAPQRVLISRQKADSRRIVNRNEVAEVLAKRGFEIHVLEDYTIAEQVELFTNADCVVAPTGAGLTNIVYATDATVVTMFGTVINSCYPVLADSLGFENGILLCDSKGTDLVVDTEKLQRLLDRLGVDEP